MDKSSVEEDSIVHMRRKPREFEPLYAGGLTRLILRVESKKINHVRILCVT